MKHYTRTIITLIIGAFVSAAHADVQYFLKFDSSSGIEGESVTQGGPAMGDRLEKSIKVLSLGFASQSSINIGSINAGGGAGVADFQGVNITAIMDNKALPDMYTTLFAGGQVADAEIIAVTSGANGGLIEVFNIKLKMIFFSSIAIEASDADVAVMNAVLEFGAVQINTFAIDNQGQSSITKTTSWSRVLNAPSFAVQ